MALQILKVIIPSFALQFSHVHVTSSCDMLTLVGVDCVIKLRSLPVL